MLVVPKCIAVWFKFPPFVTYTLIGLFHPKFSVHALNYLTSMFLSPKQLQLNHLAWVLLHVIHWSPAHQMLQAMWQVYTKKFSGSVEMVVNSMTFSLIFFKRWNLLVPGILEMEYWDLSNLKTHFSQIASKSIVKRLIQK